jgi:hypothetical protein
VRSRLNIANVIFVTALVLATALVIVILRNPATRANLEDPEFYDRTELALLDRDYVYTGYGDWEGVLAAGGDPVEVGRILYVRAGCVGCHGIFAQGATVGGELWEIEGEDIEDFHRDLRDGPAGMPAYPADLLTEDEVDSILTFLAAAPAEAAVAGVTTTTTTRPPIVTTTAPPVTTTTTTAGDGTGTTTAGGDSTTTTTTVPVSTNRTLAAPRVEPLTIDGDPSDWDGIPELGMTLYPTIGESADEHDATLRVAHDGEFIYVLFTVDDDYNWSEIDPRFAGAPSVMFPIEPTAGAHMGGEDPSGLPSLGLVDIWYWRLECPIGAPAGGSVNEQGSGKAGNDAACNLDDEWASEPEEVDDDDDAASENSLLGAFGHSNPVDDGDGTWYFEFRRPLQTGDPLDAQFSPGAVAKFALAYWDPDAGQAGWGRRDHIQSSDDGWIDVTLEP